MTNDWFQKLIADKDGNPNEHIVAAMWGSIAVFILAMYLCYHGTPPTLTDFGVAHGTVWGSTGVAQMLSKGS